MSNQNPHIEGQNNQDRVPLQLADHSLQPVVPSARIVSSISFLSTYTLYALLLFSPLVRGSVQQWALTAIQLVVVVLLMLMMLEKGITGGPLFKKSPIDRPLIALILAVILSFFFALYKPDGIEALALLATYIALFYITLHTVRTRDQQRHLVYVILLVSVIISVIALLKHFSPVDLAWWSYPDLSPDIVGITGPYANHNHLAGYLEMTIPLLLGLFLTRTRRSGILYLMLYVTAILLFTHILTLSRGGWVSLGLALFAMASILLLQQRFRQKKILSLIMTGTAIVLLFILSSTQTVERILTLTENETVLGAGGRMFAWQGIGQMIIDNPLFGTGPGSFATVFTQYQPPGIAARFFYAHNDYLHIIAETGLILIPILCWLLYTVFAIGLNKLQNPSRQVWGITLGALTGILAMLIHSISDFNLHIPANAVVFTVLAALVCIRVEERKQ